MDGYRLVAVFGPQKPGGRAWETRLLGDKWVLRVDGGPLRFEYHTLEEALAAARDWEGRRT